jgi:hypothetical protein
MAWNHASVLIAGYEDDPLIDGMSFLADALFWPTYLASLAGPEDDTMVDDAFGVDREDMADCYRRLTDPVRWPVFQVSLAQDHEINVIFRNFEEDMGVDFVFCPAGGGGSLQLATLEGHFRGPGLSWPDLAAVSGSPPSDYGVVDPAARLLLLLPAMGDGDLPATAAPMVASALAACGAGSASQQLADALLDDHPMWDLPHWRRDKEGAIVCDGQWSRRNPDAAGAFTPSEALEISLALRSRPTPL